MTDPKVNLTKVLKHFSMYEICRTAIFQFPETNLYEIQKIIARKNDLMSKKNIIRELLYLVDALPDEELNSRFCNLLLLAVNKSKTKTWTAFKLKIKDAIDLQRDTLNELKKSLDSYGLLADINMITLEGKHVFSVTEKTRGRKGIIHRQNPIFFQLYINQPYLFCGRPSLDENIFHAVVSGLGYCSSKKCHLSGRKVSDLLRMLRYKDSKNHNADFLTAEPELSREIKVTPGRVDYSQFDNMKKYADEIIGVDPPLLQKLKIGVLDAPWYPVDQVKGMEDQSMKGVTLAMGASNILEFIKKLISDGVVVQPVPDYLKAIITSGKNDFKITK